MKRKTNLSLQFLALLGAAIVVSYFGQSYQTKKTEQSVFNFDFLKTNQNKANQNSELQAEKARQILETTESVQGQPSKVFEDAKLVTFNPDKSLKGYTIFPLSGPDQVYLLSPQGELAHMWDNLDVDRARLLPNGNLLALHGSKNRLKVSPWREMRKEAAEYDWLGKKVWSYKSPYVIHHDLQRLNNGNTLLLLKVPVPKEFSAKVTDPLRASVEIKGDQVIEVNPVGETVWKWNTWEHIDINNCGHRACVDPDVAEPDMSEYADWTHLNTISVIPENRWYDAGDKRFKPGNLVVMPRNFWTIYVVDRDSGKIVWEYRGDYKGGLIGGHEPHMIKKGLPGAGNIIVVDNGSNERGASFILEINPTTKKTEWVYDAGDKFFTRARGSVQRLPNGNTFISEDRSGRAFEVTKEGEVVWDMRATTLLVRAGRYAPGYVPQLK